MVSNLCKNFSYIVWHQKPTVYAAGLPIKSFANTITYHSNSTRDPNTYSIYKISCHRCENLNKKAFFKRNQFPFARLLLRWMGWTWCEYKLKPPRIFCFITGPSEPAVQSPPSRFWQEWRENLPLHKALNYYFHPLQKFFSGLPTGLPHKTSNVQYQLFSFAVAFRVGNVERKIK